MDRPHPCREIRLVSLRHLRGANFWSTRSVTRMDVAVGAYDEISSAEAPGFTDRLVELLPGLWEHRCSIGEWGGFVTRLERGTYAPHIIEHVALELQSLIGHPVGFGRARGGDRPGEYTVVFAHRHAEVGRRAAAHALEIVQRAFAGAALAVEPALSELRRLAQEPDVPPLRQHVRCVVTGSGPRGEVRDALLRRWGAGAPVVDLAPAYLLDAGLPFARAELAVVVGDRLCDVPQPYRGAERAAQLLSVVADALEPDGLVVVSSGASEVQARVRDAGRRLAVFAVDGEASSGERETADAVAWIRQGRIILGNRGALHDVGPLRPHPSPAAQLVEELVGFALADEDPRCLR